MTGITFKRIAPDESRIYDGAGDHVGDVYALDDPLCAGARYFVVHLDPKTRAGLAASTTADRIREVTESRVASHPLWGDLPWPGVSLGSASNASSEFGRSPFGVTLSVAIVAARRFPLRSLSPSLAGSLRAPLASRAVRSVHPSQRLGQAPPPMGSVQVERNTPPT